MSAPILPGTQPGPSSPPSAPASQRAREIQHALKSIVLQTASTLRSQTQLARLQSSTTTTSSATATAAASVNENSSTFDQLTGDCSRYLSLVHGLRDYLLHAQAALEIELEAATQREAKEAELAAIAAAEALKRQQEAEEEAERRRIEEREKAASAKEGGDTAQEADAKKEEDSFAELATPPLPADSTMDASEPKVDSSDQKPDAGTGAKDAIVIDSDGDDEDDVPLAFAPKAGAVEGKPIDLTDSPALANAAKPLPTEAATTAASTAPTQDATSTSTAAATAPAGIPGLDLSAFGIDMSSLTNLPDLSSLGIPSLANNAPSSTTDATALAPATDFSELEKMMGIDVSSSSNAANTGTNDAASSAMPDLSSLGSFHVGEGAGGFGDDNDMFGSGSGGLDLSNFDFSSLAGGGDAAMGAGGGVDLSSFLTNFTSSAGDGETKESGAGG